MRIHPRLSRVPRAAALPLVVTTALVTGPGWWASAAPSAPYLVGAGIYDITGAVAETGAFGYAARQEMNGLHERLYSHAFVIGDPASGKRVVFVSADLGAMFPSIRQGVIDRLRARFGETYTDENVMLTATHTHVGTSGLAHEKLYQIAGADSLGYGFDQRNLDTVVGGIVESIVRADAATAPGAIEVASGDLPGATKNRSAAAYAANKDANAFDRDVDTLMTQLKMTRPDGTPVGLINWFATHPTSLSLKSRQISGDNKGYAQYAFEQQLGSAPTDRAPFVAAFANTNEGDAVPTAGNAFSSPGFTGGKDEFANAEAAGRQQFDKAHQLWNTPGRALNGPVDHRARWADFGNYVVRAEFTQGVGPKKLCAPARGFSFAAGGENGPSNIPGIYEGMTKGTFSLSDAINRIDTSPLGGLVRATFGAISLAWQDPCQEQKPVLLPTGAWKMAPTVLPVQLLRVGNIAILGVPGEATTMSGRRLRATVAAELEGTGVDTVVIAGLANAYTGYIATREEYALQHYEGASTEFGPHELGAFRQEASRLAAAMKTGAGVADDRKPPRISQKLTLQRPGVVFDDKPLRQSFGQVLTQPEPAYRRGQTASAVFRGGHPKNNYRTMGTFLTVQRWDGSAWVDHLTDRDWDTSLIWQRDGAAASRTTVQWRIRDTTPAGRYRLVQTGDWKNGWNGAVTPYTGTSREFTVD